MVDACKQWLNMFVELNSQTTYIMNERFFFNFLIFHIVSMMLSICELKAISSALVLHYPLNDAYVEGTTNIASNLSPSQIGG